MKYRFDFSSMRMIISFSLCWLIISLYHSPARLLFNRDMTELYSDKRANFKTNHTGLYKLTNSIFCSTFEWCQMNVILVYNLRQLEFLISPFSWLTF